MFRSLRARLWLSYAALIFSALCIVASVLLVYLLRNPLLYRRTLLQVGAAQTLLASPDAAAGGLEGVARAYGVRIVVFDANGRLESDTGRGQGRLRLPAMLSLRPSGLERDQAGKWWFYSVRQQADGSWLLVAAPRPKVVPLAALLTDELTLPFLEGGAIALLLSLLLAYAVARWIADPLQRLVAAAARVPAEEPAPVQEGGPQEIRTLTRAFNSMAARVRAGNAAQRDFVANVSHELKTPLTSIQGFAQALMDGTAEDPQARRQAAQVIHDEAGRMHRMALDLLALARMDAGTARIQAAPVDMAALLRGLCERFQPLADAAGIRLELSVPDGLPAVIGDGDRLGEVFSNLLDNAIKFTPSGGTVALRAMESGREIQVSVTDTGRGIPAAVLPRIFDRFYRADAARAGGREHGAGLGLAIAREIMLAHGGRISVRSAEGRGTGFVVHLPLTR